MDPDALVQAAAQQPERLRLDLSDHPLSRSAMEYAVMVKEWFDEQTGAAVPGFPLDPADPVEEAFEVVRWFQFQIAAKLTSALNCRLEEAEDEPELPHLQPHSDGCAKVALIGIERSIAAWGVLLNRFPGKSEILRSMLSRLERLHRETKEAFPQAGSFLRPGFDFMPTIQ